MVMDYMPGQLVQLHFAFQDTKYLYMVMDYMPGQLRVQLHFAFQDTKYLYMVMDYMPGQFRIRMIHSGLNCWIRNWISI